MSHKIHIQFKWNRDEAYDAMNDASLNEKATRLIQTATTCEDIRAIDRELAQDNEILAETTLRTFMKADLEGRPRYIAYIQNILRYGVYIDNIELDHSTSTKFLESVKMVGEDVFGFEVKFKIPKENKIGGWKRKDYIDEFNDFRSCLADSLWEGMPGSEAVHDSGAVVTYRVW